MMNLASTLAGTFMGVVQYNRDNRAFEVSVHIVIVSCSHHPPQGATDNHTLDDLCDVMTDTSLGDELDRYAAVNSAYLKLTGEDHLDVRYQEYVDFMKGGVTWDSPAAEGGKG